MIATAHQDATSVGKVIYIATQPASTKLAITISEIATALKAAISDGKEMVSVTMLVIMTCADTIGVIVIVLPVAT